jgi:Protein of unknown function (DUF2752)
MQFLKKFPLELIIWIGSLSFLGSIDPYAKQMSICVFNWIGLSWCPGCGLGHSISFLLHGEFFQSWNAHVLGGFGLMVLMHRILQLLRLEYLRYQLKFNVN